MIKRKKKIKCHLFHLKKINIESTRKKSNNVNKRKRKLNSQTWPTKNRKINIQ